MNNNSTLRYLAKDLSLGVLLYKTYYYPKAVLQKCIKQGFLNVAIDNIEKSRMEKAAYNLPTIAKYNFPDEPLDIYFLTGKKYWYQTCFCAYSMIQQAKINLRPVIYDDGSLKAQYQQEITRIFPNARIVSLESIEARLDDCLPKDKFPNLRERRLQQPLLRKLTDFHAGSKGWKLFLDSDMLFFKNPAFLINWLKSPEKPCYMVDVFNAYGYSPELMTSLAEAKIPDLVNIGIFGLKSEDIDWEELETWVKTLLEKEGTHYNVTQCLSAMYLAKKDCAIVPAKDYVVLPDETEGMTPQAVLHHYVADSKPWYFRYGWKRVSR